jgi:hypothetical protein
MAHIVTKQVEQGGAAGARVRKTQLEERQPLIKVTQAGKGILGLRQGLAAAAALERQAQTVAPAPSAAREETAFLQILTAQPPPEAGAGAVVGM